MRTCLEYANEQQIDVYEQTLSSGGCLPLSRGCIHVYDQTIQTSSLKTLGANQSQALCGASLGRQNQSLQNINGQYHMTQMAAMAKNSKNLLVMKHQEIKLYKVYINYDPVMTLTFLRQGKLNWSPMHLNGENCQNVI